MAVKQLPDGTWFYRFQHGKYGYRKQGFRTRLEAEKAETIKKAEVVRRESFGQGLRDDIKLRELADMFFEEYTLPHKRSWKEDRAQIRLMKSFFGERRVSYPDPMVFVPNSKTSRSRYVPLAEQAVALLAELTRGKGPEVRALDPVAKQTISEWFRELIQEAGLPDFRFHDLRHTFAAHMLTKGVPIYKVSKILGHSTVTVTEQHYGHLSRGALSEEIRHIDDVMSLPRIGDMVGGRKEAVKSVQNELSDNRNSL